jgi:hypothetical protein
MMKVRVRIGQAEAEVESEPEHIRDAIELIPEVARKLAAEPSPPERAPSQNSGASATGLAGVPRVTLERGDSLADAIGKFFADDWGRDRRKLSDVREALQSYGLNYPKQSVAVALLRLAKTAKIRRFKAEDGEYVYTSGVFGEGHLAQAPEQGSILST